MNPSYVIAASIVILLFSAQNCFAQTMDKKPPQIFMQIQIRDADGRFVGYVEGYPQIFYLDKAIDWVEPLAHKSTIMIDGERHEMLQHAGTLDWSESVTMGGYFLKLPVNGRTTTVLYFHHDSFHISPGDVAHVFWTVIK
jgi:hypothetical protein